MRILLDECVDARLAREIVGHDVRCPPDGLGRNAGRPVAWTRRGRVRRVRHVFVTTDRNLPYQQNLARFNLVVIVLEARTNRLVDLKGLVPRLLKVLSTAAPGRATRVVG